VRDERECRDPQTEEPRHGHPPGQPARVRTQWLRDRIGEIKAPIQVMWGVADHVVPVSQADGLPASIKVTRIADAGHIPHIEKADEVSKLVQALA